MGRRRLPWGLMLWAASIPAAAALDTLRLEAARVEGAGWHAERVDIALSPREGGRATLSARIASLTLPDPVGTLGPVEFHCPDAVLDTVATRCPRGTLTAAHPRFGHLEAELALSSGDGGKGEVRLSDLRVAGLSLSGTSRWSPAGWSVHLAGSAAPEAVGGVSVAGSLSLEADAEGDVDGASGFRLQVLAGGVEFSNAEGTVAGAGVGGRLAVTGARSGSEWAVTAEARLDAGEVYVDPLFMETPPEGIGLEAALRLNPGGRSLTVEGLAVDHHGVLTARASGEITLDDPPVPRRLNLAFDAKRLDVFYATYVAPFLIGTGLDEMDALGALSGELRYGGGKEAGGGPALSLDLSDVHLDARDGRVGIYGLDGALRWDGAAEEEQTSWLSWKGGHLYQLDFGRSRLVLSGHGRRVRLAEPAAIPVLDGVLQVERLTLDRPREADPELALDAVLTPVSMERFSQAMGWRPLSGTLSGVIPTCATGRGTWKWAGCCWPRPSTATSR